MKKYLSVHSALFVGLIIGLGLSITAAIIYTQKHRILSVSNVDDLYTITYTDGVTKFIYHDYDYSSVEAPGWNIETTVSAIPIDSNDKQLGPYRSPDIVHEGEIHPWDHDVYVFESTKNGQSGILYIDRQAKTMSVMYVPYNILSVLDERDVTKFAAVTGAELVIGSFADGKILATATLQDNGGASGIVSNWENTKLAFFSGQCDLGGDTLQIMTWDTTTGSLVDHRSELHTPDCGHVTSIVYNHDKDMFDVYNNNFGNNSVNKYVGSIK